MKTLRSSSLTARFFRFFDSAGWREHDFIYAAQALRVYGAAVIGITPIAACKAPPATGALLSVV
jgi:hypothetical protein